MNKSALYLTILFLLCAGLKVHAQKMPSDYVEEGNAAAQQMQYQKAIAAFRYVVTHHPRNEAYPMAYFNMGVCYVELKRFDSAMKVFKNILHSNFNEMDRVGRGLMDDPYADYRHRSCELLAHIYEQKGLIDSAIHYFSLADSLYPYHHFCGNAYAANAIHKALTYARYYGKKGKKDQQIATLLPVVFEDRLAGNEEAIVELRRLLRNRKGLKQQLDSAVDAMYPRPDPDRPANSRYYFRFLGAEVEVPGGYVHPGDTLDRASSLEMIQNSRFYEMIGAL